MKGKTILIISLIVISLAVGGYFAFNYFKDEKKKKDELNKAVIPVV